MKKNKGQIYLVFRNNNAPVFHRVWANSKKDALDSFNIQFKKHLRFSRKATGYEVYNVISLADYVAYNFATGLSTAA